MALILTIANQKGGCGKTTTVMNLAGGLTKAKYRVLVVDADPQASATLWSLARGQAGLPFDVMTARQLGGRVEDLLTLAASRDIILVDCPPGIVETQDEVGRFARSVLSASDALLVPLRPSPADFAAAAGFVRYLARVRPPGVKMAVLVNALRKTVLGGQARDQAALLFASIPEAIVLEATIGLRESITEVSGSGMTIFDYAPKHEAAREYTNLTKEIIQWLSNAPRSSQTPSSTSM
jgi:chromosome partitioning protein